MCNALEISRSGYYAWLTQRGSKRLVENEKLLEGIKNIRKNKRKKVYGAPRMHQELIAMGLKCSKNRVARIMSNNGIKSSIRKKWKPTNIPKNNHPPAEDLVQQDFSASRTNEIWTSDITYLWTVDGWLYLAVVLDVFSRKIVGWSLQENMDNNIVLKAIMSANNNRNVWEGTIFHSDQGGQFNCLNVRNLLSNLGIKQSMGRRGSCYDNAITESFFHTLKVELVYQEKFKTKKEAKLAIFEYIEVFYNRQRRHSALNYYSPEEFENKVLVGL